MGELEKIINQYNKKLKGSIVTLSKCPHKKITRVSTGSFSLDIATGGGIPYGSIVEIYGEESTGKSLVALKTIIEAQKQDKECVYIDLEGSITQEWAEKVGVDPEKLWIARPKTAEIALQMMDDLASSNEVGIIVVDSVAALCPAVEVEEDVEKQTMGVAAKLMSKSLRKLTSTLQPIVLDDEEAYNPCSVIFINQTREKIGIMYGSPLTTPGGKALKFYSSIRLHMTKGEIYRDEKKKVIGLQIKFQTKKNKTHVPFQVGALTFFYEGYIDNEAAVVDYAIAYELIEQGGAWFYFGDDKFQGRPKLIEYLKNKPKVLAKLKTDVLKLIGK